MSYNIAVCNLAIAVDPDELNAFKEAIKDPELRKEITSILEEAGLLRASHRRPA